jgi:cytidylate kinase
MVLISGPIAVGKTTLAVALQNKLPADLVASGPLLAGRARLSRSDLQARGQALDLASGGEWLVDEVVAHHLSHETVIVDAVRTKRQVSAFRLRCPRVVHIHLTADYSVRAARFAARAENTYHQEGGGLAALDCHPSEQEITTLASLADSVLDTTLLTNAEVAVLATAITEPVVEHRHLGLA